MRSDRNSELEECESLVYYHTIQLPAKPRSPDAHSSFLYFFPWKCSVYKVEMKVKGNLN
jgi:hypothetical protein